MLFARFWWRSVLKGVAWVWIQIFDNISRLLILLAVAAGLTTGAIMFGPTWARVAIVLSAIALLLGHGAYLQWREADDLLRPYLQRAPLQPTIVPSQVPGEHWLNVRVRNPNSVPLSNCYAKITRYAALSNVADPLPRPGHRLPWRTHGKEPGSSRLLANLAGGSEDYLDLAMTFAKDAAKFHTPMVSEDQRFPVRPSFALPPGEYQADLEVGSESELIPARRLRITIVFEGFPELAATIDSALT